MKKYFKTALISLGFLLLASCQTFTGQNLFNPIASDNALTSSVNAAMMSSPELSGVPIHIETRNGVVMLSGYVKTIRQSDTAGDIASKVGGVKSVENNLIVRK